MSNASALDTPLEHAVCSVKCSRLRSNTSVPGRKRSVQIRSQRETNLSFWLGSLDLLKCKIALLVCFYGLCLCGGVEESTPFSPFPLGPPGAASNGMATDGTPAALHARTASTSCAAGTTRTPGRTPPALTVVCARGPKLVAPAATFSGLWWASTVSAMSRHHERRRRSLRRGAPTPRPARSPHESNSYEEADGGGGGVVWCSVVGVCVVWVCVYGEEEEGRGGRGERVSGEMWWVGCASVCATVGLSNSLPKMNKLHPCSCMCTSKYVKGASSDSIQPASLSVPRNYVTISQFEFRSSNCSCQSFQSMFLFVFECNDLQLRS